MPAPDLDSIARRHGVSPAAAAQLYAALRASGGAQAQFDHPDLGGPGQWMPGMVMVGRMGDAQLKSRVEALCRELAALAGGERSHQASAADRVTDRWWPADWGAPSAAGSQGDGSRYAYFAGRNRLAVDREGAITVYDTAGRRITGVSQSHGGGRGSLTFTTEAGEVDLSLLKVVDR